MTFPTDMPVTPRSDVVVRSLGDGAVLVNMSSGAVFELNRVGSEIWELLAGGMTPGRISEMLARRYSVAGDVIVADVQRLLETLASQRLIEPVAASRDFPDE